MPIDSIEEIMKLHGKPETFEKIEIPYRRFKSRKTPFIGILKELLIYIEKEV
jgi:hypothetical protein